MRLIFLLISFLLLGLFISWYLSRLPGPTSTDPKQVDRQLERMEHQIDNYKQQMENQESQIYQELSPPY